MAKIVAEWSGIYKVGSKVSYFHTLSWDAWWDGHGAPWNESNIRIKKKTHPTCHVPLYAWKKHEHSHTRIHFLVQCILEGSVKIYL